MSSFEFNPSFLLPILTDRYFSVPLYQRSYSWSDDEVGDFWHDAMRAIDDGGEYFLGNIVLSQEAEGEGVSSIIDGQQRLATTTILLSAMRDIYAETGEVAVSETIHRQHIAPHDLETYEDRPRVKLNAIDDPFYQGLIVTRTTVSPSADSHHRIQGAYDNFRSRLRAVVNDNPNSWKDRFAKVTRFLNKQARVVVVKAATDADAFTIFETLNDRGADLTIADLLKNYLFSRAGTELPAVQQLWLEALSILSEYQEEKDLVTFLRHLWSSQKGATRERDLYREIKEAIQKKADVLKFAQSLRDGARFYGAIISPDAEFWKEYGLQTKESVATLARFSLQQNRPLLLAVLQHFTKVEIENTIRFMVSWSIRGIVAGGIGGGQAERYICEAAVAIRSGSVKTASELQTKLTATIASDTLFHQSFERFRTTGNSLARYMLLAIERKMIGQKEPELVPNQDVEEVNLEHILPQKAKQSEWPLFSVDDVSAYAYRLGNMTLLQKGRNNALGNKAWLAKRPTIAASTYKLNAKIGTKPDWTKAEIETRQKELADWALKVWPL